VTAFLVGPGGTIKSREEAMDAAKKLIEKG